MKTIQFRSLTANEAHLLQKMLADDETGSWQTPFHDFEDYDQVRVAYRYQAHRQSVEYTVALVRLGDGSLLVGATKRNPSDPQNPIRGQVEALRRAFASDVAFALPADASKEPEFGGDGIDLAERRGVADYKEGVMLGACPYPDKRPGRNRSMAEAWRKGWRGARSDEGLA